jgi:hypothetical protein
MKKRKEERVRREEGKEVRKEKKNGTRVTE